MKPPIDWLLDGEPYIEYRTRLDLLGEPPSTAPVKTARLGMLSHPPLRGLVSGLSSWPGEVIASHKSAGQPFHKLTFLADLGLTARDTGMDVIIDRILAHQEPNGPFQLPINISSSYGGTDQDTWGWALCDAPLVVYALGKFGLESKPPVKAAAKYLTNLVRDNGWPCVVSKELGTFRGPGRKEDPCPFATLAMLKALSEIEAHADNEACHTGAEALLSLWSQSLNRHPYIFYMGNDFRKLKVPFIWYDLLHVLDVLTRFPWLKQDPRLRDMLDVLKSKMDPAGRFTLESAWAAWKEWEFGQKKTPSRWLTLLSWRILMRMN